MIDFLHQGPMRKIFQSGIQSTLAIGIMFLCFMSSAYADQTGTNYGIPFDVNNAGGADVSKSNIYLLSDSLGEPIVGHGDSNSYQLDSGYRQPSAADFISMACTDFVNLGSVVGTGQRTGSGTCTVYTDAYDGYRMVWQAGANNRSGLVGHWKLDETSGTTAYDISGNNNHGTLTLGPTISTDTPSKYFSTRSVSFDGSNDFITASATGIPTGGSARTFAAWIKYAGNGGVIVGTNAASSQKYYLEMVNVTGTWYLFTDGLNGANNIVLTGDQIPVSGQWNHIAFSKDAADNWTYYLNGVEKKRGTFTIAINTSAATSLYIGHRADVSGYNFNGNIDDVRIFDRSLSGDEVRDLASLAPPGSLTASGSQVRHIPGIFFPSTGGLVGHWKLEEAFGGTTVADSSGYNRDGTPTGAGGANNMPQPSTSVPGSTTFLTTKSLDFDGTDDYVGITNSIPLANNPFSISFWASATSYAVNRAAFSLHGGGVLAIYPYDGNAGNGVRVYFGENIIDQNSTSIAADGQFHHFVFVSRSATDHEMFVDGVSVGTSSASHTYGTATTTCLGCFAAAQNYAGALDDVRLYSRALSDAEIKALYSEPQTWSVAATESAWGARLSSDSTDHDAKWGNDGGSEKWLNLGDGAYAVVRRPSATPLEGSVQHMEFRAEVGSSKIQTTGVYRGVTTFTVVGY